MLDAVSDVQEIDIITWGGGTVVLVGDVCFRDCNADGVAHGDTVVVARVALYVVGAKGVWIAIGNMVNRDLSAIVCCIGGCVRKKDQSVGIDGHPVDDRAGNGIVRKWCQGCGKGRKAAQSACTANREVASIVCDPEQHIVAINHQSGNRPGGYEY